MTATDAMKHFICYIKNDGTTIDQITQSNASDLWEQICIVFNQRFNTGASGGSTGGTLGDLAVVSLPGVITGTTAVTVTGADSGSTLMYKVSTGSLSIGYGDDLSGWSTWDGTSDITAADGLLLYIAQVDDDNKAMKAGVTRVNANIG